MAETENTADQTPTPDSISETIDRQQPVEQGSRVSVTAFSDDLASAPPPVTEFSSAAAEYSLSASNTTDIREIPAYEPHSLLPRVNNDLQLPSAFRPFVSEPHRVSPERAISPTTSQQPITSTPLTRRAERLTIPGAVATFSSNSQLSPSPTSGGIITRDVSNNDDDDGRTTASAPPCTPAPEPHVQVQSPFRSNRQIKRIDLLAMSRSRQSDRAENARRDGRLAPSPRKKDEVLRNSGFLFQPSMNRGFTSGLPATVHSRATNCDNFVSPERLVVNGSSSTTSPNVDVVSIDDPNDESKCMLSIQFHDFERGEQMLRCNLCGFVTNNQKFYRRHRRQHNRPYNHNQIFCNQCDYSTTQIRRMREHSLTHQHISHQTASNNHHFSASGMIESNNQQNPPFQGHFFVPNGSIFPSTSGNRPMTLAIGGSAASNISNSTSFGIHPFVPAAQDHSAVRVNNEVELQPPPRGSAMLGNYEGQVANCMRTVITNFMSQTRSHPSNSVTSSNLYHSIPQESHTFTRTGNNHPPGAIEENFNLNQFWNHSSGSSIPGRSLHGNNSSNNSNPFMKIKLEPSTAPSISQMTEVVRECPSSTQIDHQISSSPPIDDDTVLDHSEENVHGSPMPEVVGSRAEARISTDTNMTDSGTQGDGGTMSDTSGSMPYIKIEQPSQSESFIGLAHGIGGSRFDRGVQCNLITMSGMVSHLGRTQSETVSSAGGVVESKCYYCGITFDDEVLYSIHIGCHSHTDPFLCNVCGKQCRNKYGFYSHIMRGHQARPNA